MNPVSESTGPKDSPAANPCLTVLVVDDEPAIRQMLVRMLRWRGCKVLSAASGAEALAMAAALEKDAIQILITDLCMPVMGGDELAAELRILRPEMKVIFTSGYSVSEMGRMGIHVPDAVYIAKPFPPRALDQAIQALLEPAPVLC